MSSCPCGKNPNQSGGRGRASTSGRGGDSSMDSKNKDQPSGCHPCGKKRRSYDGLGDGRGGTATGMSNTGRVYSGPLQDLSGSGEGNENFQQYSCPGQGYEGGPSQGCTYRNDVYVGSTQGHSGHTQRFIDPPDINIVAGSKMGRISCPGSFGGSCNKSSCLGCKKVSSDGRSYKAGDRKSHGPPDILSYRSCDQHSGSKGDETDLNNQNAGNPLNFEMNEASWGLCKAAAIFLAGVYLTTRMHNVANLIG